MGERFLPTVFAFSFLLSSCFSYFLLFLHSFSPLASPWKYKFPLGSLFKWMLCLFNSYTRNLELLFFSFQEDIFRGAGGGGSSFACQSNVYLQTLGSHQTIQTWMGNKCIVFVKLFFFTKRHMHSCVAFIFMIWFILLKNILYLQTYKNNKLFLSMSKLIP